MKTDRRHELQTNVLADWIGKHLQQLQGHSKTILAVILLVIAAAIGGTFWAQDQATRVQASWNQFFQAFGERDSEALEKVAAKNRGTIAGIWAHLAEADLKLAEGLGDLYTNRDNAKENLAEAERNYLAVAAAAANETLLRDRAWFGLGQVYESQAELEKAKEYYNKLVSDSPTSALGKAAKERFDALNDPSTEKWYNWFANQKPRPMSIPGMSDDLGLPNDPSDLRNLSDRPDLSFPRPAPIGPNNVTPQSTTDSPEPGPELNSPASEPASPPEDSENAGDNPISEPEAAEANQAPAKRAADEPAPQPSEASSEASPASGDATPE